MTTAQLCNGKSVAQLFEKIEYPAPVMEILENPALSNILGSLEEKYEKEFETYGVAHLRLPDEE